MGRIRSVVVAGLMATGCVAPVDLEAEDRHAAAIGPEPSAAAEESIRPSAQPGDALPAPERGAEAERGVYYEVRVSSEDEEPEEEPTPAPDPRRCTPGEYEVAWPADVPEDARDLQERDRDGELVFEGEGELHDLRDEDWYVVPEEAVKFMGRAIEVELKNVPEMKFFLEVQKRCEGKMSEPAEGTDRATFVDSCAAEGPLYIRVGADSFGSHTCLPYRLAVRAAR